MAYRDIAIVNGNLQTSTAEGADFGTLIFIGAHARFRERVRTYSSLTGIGADFASTSNEYKAAQAAFAQTPPPPSIKIGRLNSTTTLTPQNVANGTIYTVKVTVNSDAFVTATFTAGGSDTATTICTALKAAIDAVPAVAARVTTTVSSGTLVIVATNFATGEYAISGLVNLTEAYTSTETPADVLNAIDIVDNQYAFISAHNHTESFVLAMAAAVATRKKIYFVSSQDEAVLGSLATPATEVFGKLKELNRLRTATLYHHTADTTFPECAFVSRWSNTVPGTEQWSIKTLDGVSVSMALNGGTSYIPLSETQKNNLLTKDSSFVTEQRGKDILYGGKTSGGEWIDVVRFMDYVEDKTEVAIFNLQYNNQKVPHDDDGYAALQSVCTSVWDRFISLPGQPKGLVRDNPYDFNFPTAAQVSFEDKANRVYTPTATLYLSGALIFTTLTINLTYPAN